MQNRREIPLGRFGWLLSALALCGIWVGCSGSSSRSLAQLRSGSPDGAATGGERVGVGVLQTLPNASDTGPLFIQPGHWQQTQLEIRAANQDESLAIYTQVLDPKENDASPLWSRVPIRYQRRVSAAKGQRRRFQSEFYVPESSSFRRDEADSSVRRWSIQMETYARGIQGMVRSDRFPAIELPRYQFSVVALATKSQDYRFLARTSGFSFPSMTKEGTERFSPSRLVPIDQADVTHALPVGLHFWTGVSHLVWGDCSPASLNSAHQQSIEDWIHFGGQIIVDGPLGESALRNSFLSRHLPLGNCRSTDTDRVGWGRFGEYWSVAEFGGKEPVPLVFADKAWPTTFEGDLASDAFWLSGCEGLVAMRRVGRGAIIMTTFPISDSTLRRWPSYGSFVHNGLLMRPARDWTYAGSRESGFLNEPTELLYAGEFRNREADPSVNSKVRLVHREPGGGWYSEGAFAQAAITELREMTGIEVPKLGLIVQLLLAYIIILVPVNWGVFRLVGRVELAWLAAPVIALVGAVVIARVVQLDVGFSRAQATVSLFEVHSGYGRGSMTGYQSYYTSLSTPWDLSIPQHSGMVLPIVSRAGGRSGGGANVMAEYQIGGSTGSGIVGFPVRSNSLGNFVFQRTWSFEKGAIDLWLDELSNGYVLANGTEMEFRSGVLAKRGNEGGIELIVVGDIKTGFRGAIVNTDRFKRKIFLGQPSEIWGGVEQWLSEEREIVASPRLISGVIREALVAPGDACLVAQTEAFKQLVEANPKCNQESQLGLVLVHAKGKGGEGDVRPDLHLPTQVSALSVEDFEKLPTSGGE